MLSRQHHCRIRPVLLTWLCPFSSLLLMQTVSFGLHIFLAVAGVDVNRNRSFCSDSPPVQEYQKSFNLLNIFALTSGLTLVLRKRSFTCSHRIKQGISWQINVRDNSLVKYVLQKIKIERVLLHAYTGKDKAWQQISGYFNNHF